MLGHGSRRAPGLRVRRPPASRVEASAGEQVEGHQAVRELLRAGRRPVHRVVIADTVAGGPAGAELRALAEAAGVAVRVVAASEVTRQARTSAPQGVVARAAPIPAATLEEVLEGGGEATGGQAERARPFLVVLDGVTDPHNLGAIARTALCAGATGLVLPERRAVGLTPAAVKAAAGAVEHIPVIWVPGVPSALADLAAAGVWTVGLDPAGATDLWSLEVATEPLGVVLGAEGRGLARLTRERCDLLARVPMRGPLASINVAATAALACFEVARRRAN